MAKNLLIVESPAKAKTIEKILGKDFTVKSSFGHLRDLPKKNDAIDIEKGFEPKYVITPDKKKVVKELKDWVKKVDEVWLATDEDREGEAISWHLCKVLGLDENRTKRIVFREITAPAIKKAIEKPRTVDLRLVNAQQARRILDRLVGFELSELLWKKVKGKLSAGRVQSVALRLVVEREREISAFEATPFFKVQAFFLIENEEGKQTGLKAELSHRFNKEEEARNFLERCKKAEFSIARIEVKPLRRRPAPPFITSTLQQEASRKLGFSVRRTMSAAQKLYEQGHITYMRTDSTNLSELALAAMADQIESEFGSKYVKTRRYKSKNAAAQEAHEAIRPTDVKRKTVSGDRDQQRLYELIRRRALASQMADADLEKTIAHIAISTVPEHEFRAEGEVLKFDGFLKVYMEGRDEEEGDETKGMLPPLKEGQGLEADQLEAVQRFPRPPARYTEATLVKKLEELGIGRPSTYAPTISRIMEEGRGYVIKANREGKERHYTALILQDGEIRTEQRTEVAGAVKNRLMPTDMGMIVSDFLLQHFDNIMDYGFTANVEKKLDEIAEGKLDWRKLLEDFYGPFHNKVEKTLKEADRASGERILGKDPGSGRTLLVRMSRFGRPVLQIGKPEELEEGEKPRYANLAPGQTLESLTFEEAIKQFQLPKTLGKYEDKEVVVKSGRYGPYLQFDGKFISLPRAQDPLEINLEQAIELIEQKRKEEAPIAFYKDLPITKGKGRFGPFLKWNGLYANIPRKIDPDTLDEATALELVKAKEEKEAQRYIHRWEDEGISVENGRWGPFIRFKRKSVKIPPLPGEKRATLEQAKSLSLEEVKAIIEAQMPGSFPTAKKKK